MSRTTREVLGDPRHAELVQLANTLLAQADNTTDAATAFAKLDAAMKVFMTIDVHEQEFQREAQADAQRGAWTCCFCGFRGFWNGGAHCSPAMLSCSPQ